MTRKIGGYQYGGSDLTTVSVTPVLTVAAAYASGDYVGTTSVPMTFAAVVEKNGRSGYVVGCTIVDDAAQSMDGELWLFDTTFTPPADSAAWTVSDAELKTCIGVIPFTTYYDSAVNSVAVGVLANPLAFRCGDSVDDIYGAYVIRDAPTYASLDITFRLFVRNN
jgi:formylmethanofuran dehydrogenase subunit A